MVKVTILMPKSQVCFGTSPIKMGIPASIARESLLLMFKSHFLMVKWTLYLFVVKKTLNTCLETFEIRGKIHRIPISEGHIMSWSLKHLKLVVKSTDSQFLRVKYPPFPLSQLQVRPELPTARGGLAMAVPSGSAGSAVVLAIGGRRTNGEKLDVVEWNLAERFFQSTGFWGEEFQWTIPVVSRIFSVVFTKFPGFFLLFSPTGLDFSGFKKTRAQTAQNQDLLVKHHQKRTVQVAEWWNYFFSFIS